jgi:hypothetical protein
MGVNQERNIRYDVRNYVTSDFNFFDVALIPVGFVFSINAGYHHNDSLTVTEDGKLSHLNVYGLAFYDSLVLALTGVTDQLLKDRKKEYGEKIKSDLEKLTVETLYGKPVTEVMTDLENKYKNEIENFSIKNRTFNRVKFMGLTQSFGYVVGMGSRFVVDQLSPYIDSF